MRSRIETLIGESETCSNLLSLRITDNLLFLSAGIAFPTCVSLNHCVCHFSPLRSDPAVNLAAGDLLKM